MMLLGASLDLTLVAKSGTWLPLVIVAIVMASLGVSYGASRLLGLPSKLSILVACGNSTCGNSAIAAVAPVIGASSEDIGASISLTAILGILTVIGLPVRAHHRLHGGARIERRSAAIGADRPARDRRGDAVARLPHRDQPRRHPFFLSEYGGAQTTAAHGNFLKNAQIVSAPSIS